MTCSSTLIILGFLLVHVSCLVNAKENSKRTISQQQHVYTISLKAKHTSRLEAECPSHIYDNILSLIRQCQDKRDVTDFTNHPTTKAVTQKSDTETSRTETSAHNSGATTPKTTTQTTNGATSAKRSGTTPASTSGTESATTEGGIKVSSTPIDEKQTTNDMKDLPTQCTAPWTLNLTESFRIIRSLDSSDLNRDYLYLDSGRFWFRFQGKAGNRLADACPKSDYPPGGCGWNGYGPYSTSYSYWSNSSMPDTPGKTNQIVLYKGCEPKLSDIYRGLATRCSLDDNGLVYHIVDKISTYAVVCGME